MNEDKMVGVRCLSEVCPAEGKDPRGHHELPPRRGVARTLKATTGFHLGEEEQGPPGKGPSIVVLCSQQSSGPWSPATSCPSGNPRFQALQSFPAPPSGLPPVFQYLSRKLGLDSIAFGYLQTTFGVLQLLGGPVFGRYSVCVYRGLSPQ